MFNAAACKRYASWALDQPPAQEHIVRAEPPTGAFRVARFALPLEVCPGTNALAEMPPWKRGKLKQQALLLMRSQQPDRLPMLAGRPWLRAIRFSSREPDRGADWSKIPIDRLTPKHGGLGLIADDRNRDIELHTHWEPAPPAAGFVLIELYQRTKTIETKEVTP